VVSFPQVPPTKSLYALSLPHLCYMPRPTHYSQFDHPNKVW
jgi:hypothetical protein